MDLQTDGTIFIVVRIIRVFLFLFNNFDFDRRMTIENIAIKERPRLIDHFSAQMESVQFVHLISSSR